MAEKILIVDDDIETLRLVGIMLQKQGFQILAAHNGAQALALAAQDGPDLVLLDVMMPDMDGYQVTRLLRKEPPTANTPILMFTAKGQVEDKVYGYEAGVDDYLTKPIHPVELVARIKALLARNRGRNPVAGSSIQGYLLGVVAPKGGMGVSSLALNLALRLHQNMKIDLVAAELRPGNDSWGAELGVASPAGLNNLLRLKPGEITAEAVEKELVRTTYGVRLLLASSSMRDLPQICAAGQLEVILQHLAALSPLTLLDIGAPILPNFDRISSLLQEVIVVTEPYPGTVNRTRLFMEELQERGFGRSRLMNVVIVNRVRADVQLSITQVQDRLGHTITQVFPPAPEQAYQAGLRNLPLTEIQPDGLLAQQYDRLADSIYERIMK